MALTWLADAQSLWQLDQQLVRDLNVNLRNNEHLAAWLDPMFFIISSTGLGWVQLLIILAFFPWRRLFISISGLRSANEPRRGLFARLFNDGPVHITVPLLISWGVTAIVDTLVKHDVPRERPSNLAWSMPQESIYANSFASGHTATSFGIAFTILFLTWNSPKRKWGILAVIWALLVGFSRVYRGVHWPSDVVSGFFVGLGCASVMMIAYPDSFRAGERSSFFPSNLS